VASRACANALGDLLSPACRSHVAASRDAVSKEAQQVVCHYVIVRSDLSCGIQAASVIHAAGESSPGDLPASTFAVALTVPDERSLVRLADDLRRASVAFTAIFEPDEPFNGQLMALGVAPRRKGELRRYLSALPLLR